jgi:hypothetical protein
MDTLRAGLDKRRQPETLRKNRIVRRPQQSDWETSAQCLIELILPQTCR